MRHPVVVLALGSSVVSFGQSAAADPIPAFPGAEGPGMYAVGGWPPLATVPAPHDADRDGMPDAWEVAQGLDPNDGSDGSHTGDAGYTNPERCLDELAQ
jgi:hypothetical protein